MPSHGCYESKHLFVYGSFLVIFLHKKVSPTHTETHQRDFEFRTSNQLKFLLEVLLSVEVSCHVLC